METRRAVIFRGQVQGVGFRWTTCRVAQSHRVRGWVRNEPDGTVRCELEGDPRQIDVFLDAVEHAMDGHVQERVEVSAGDGTIPDEGVEVRR